MEQVGERSAPFGVDQTAQLVRQADEDKKEEVGEAVLAHKNAGILVIDGDGRCLDANATACRLLGNARADILGRKVCDMMPGADKATCRHIGSRLAAGESYSGQIVLLRTDGTPFLVAVKIVANVGFGVHLGVIAHLSDHHELRYESAILQTAGELLSLGAWAWTPETDQWWWSDALYSIYGVPPADGPPGSDWLDSIHHEDRCRVSDAMGAVANGEPLEIEYRILRSSAQDTRWIRSKAQREPRSPGSPRRVLGAVIDITNETAAQSG
ncbi:PAS domain-containing protein [Rhodothermus sp. AH-315-K08]|nr:PAS domain-containing protein [Rhodothermus sp. AH-315-K08]